MFILMSCRVAFWLPYFLTVICSFIFLIFFFSSRRRHTRCALVTGVQTCALPICPSWRPRPIASRSAPRCCCLERTHPAVAADHSPDKGRRRDRAIRRRTRQDRKSVV